MIHPDTELRRASDEIGLGVFATRPIPKGTIVWALDELDQRFPAERVRRLGRRYEGLLERYGFLNGLGERVLCWDLARWMNHSCEANVLSSGWHFDIAIRDVAAGEELTNDYGALNIECSFACLCGSERCRGTVHPEDFDAFAPIWDAKVQEAFPSVRRVPQPLWQWVPNKRLVSAASRNPQQVPSVRGHMLPADVEVPLRRRAARA